MNRNDVGITNLLVVDSVYSLLIYMILFDEKYDHTLFVFSDGIRGNVRNKIPTHIYIPSGIKGFFKFLLLCIKDKRLSRILLNKRKYSFYGHEHLLISLPFLHHFNVIEDGLLNYRCSNRCFPVNAIIPNRIPGDISEVHKIYLSNIEAIPEEISSKVVCFSLKDAWKRLDIYTQHRINDFFDFKAYALSHVNAILFTQPLSEDGFVSEDKKIAMYRDILLEFKHLNIAIKPHPREKTNYRLAFPAIDYIDGGYPAELISLNNDDIQTVITIFSSAIQTFINCRRIFIGTEKYPELYGKVGVFQSSDTL